MCNESNVNATTGSKKKSQPVLKTNNARKKYDCDTKIVLRGKKGEDGMMVSS